MIELVVGAAIAAAGAIAGRLWNLFVEEPRKDKKDREIYQRQLDADKLTNDRMISREAESRREAQEKEYHDLIRKQYGEVLSILYEQAESIISVNHPSITPDESDDTRYFRISGEFLARRTRLREATTLLRLEISNVVVVHESIKADQILLNTFSNHFKWRSERIDKSVQAWPEFGTASAAWTDALAAVESSMRNVLEQYLPALDEVRQRILQQALLASEDSKQPSLPMPPTLPATP
jgi:hypothetical protein